MEFFDDSRLDDPDALRRADSSLRRIASAGARVRREAEAADAAIAAGGLEPERPRAVLAIGPEARLIRAVLEPSCPVPFLAWPSHALPAWVSALDLIVVLAPDGGDEALAQTVQEARRRGARLLVAAPEGSHCAERAGSAAILLPVTTQDAEAAVIVVLTVLHHLGLGPVVLPERVADALDQVAVECGPAVNVAQNPAKDLALGLADATPLVWGGSVLAARASRRVAEALRIASGRATLAGEIDDIAPLIAAVGPRDPFADPDEAEERRPALIVLDDDQADEATRADEERLRRTAEAHEVRVCTVRADMGGPVERYVALEAHGLWAAAYVGIGLGREGTAR